MGDSWNRKLPRSDVIAAARLLLALVLVRGAASQCHPACSDCWFDEICGASQWGWSYMAGECYTCPAGTYGNGADSDCFQCGAPCATCTNVNVCTSCVSGYWLKSDGSCVTSCPNGLYRNPATWAAGAACVAQCAAGTDPVDGGCAAGGVVCLANCDSCTASGTCDACNDGFYWDGAACGATCPAGTYPDAGARTCAACTTQNCAACDASACSACSSGYWVMADGTCVADCPGWTVKQPAAWAQGAHPAATRPGLPPVLWSLLALAGYIGLLGHPRVTVGDTLHIRSAERHPWAPPVIFNQ